VAKIVVLSMAYRGDVHPYVPVASELARRGHNVTFVVPREFHDELSGEPFDCVHSGSDFGPAELNKHGDWLAKWGMRFGGARLLELYFGKFTVPHLESQFTAIHEALDGADVLFTHSTAAVVGAMAAEARNVPWISGDLFPMLIPTRTASPFAAVRSLGPLNTAAWHLARSTRPNRLTFAKDFADFRRQKGLDDTSRSAIDLRISPYLNLGMASPEYIPAAPDWPGNYTLTGFTHWNQPDAAMPDGLQAFLDADDPPLLITFGTLAAASHSERFSAAIGSAEALGLRTLSLCSLPSTATRLQETYDSGRHFVADYAPLAQVLDQVRAVVHSGSHGTNSMTLRAGKPSAIMPAIVDQVWHAKRQETLGTGAHVRRAKDLRPAIERLVHDQSMSDAASRLGQRLREEQGTMRTSDEIERFLD
jgi:sterol 3beta-glucosyltransferase